MSFGIIIRKSDYTRKSGAPRFQRHFNRELTDRDHPNGMMMHTKEQYYGELKRRGLEPYDPKAKDCAKVKPVTLSEDTKQTIKAINEQTHKGKFKPSGRLIQKMESKGVKMSMTKEDLRKLPAHYREGGICADNPKRK